MQITVTTDTEAIFTLEVAEDMELENFKALCQTECGIEPLRMLVIFEGNRLTDNKKDLKGYGMKDGDIVMLQKTDFNPTPQASAPLFPNLNFGAIQVPSSFSSSSATSSAANPNASRNEHDPAFLRDMLLANAEQRSLLKQNNPRLAEALEKGLDEFTRVLQEQQSERSTQQQMRMRMLLADPFDMEAQTLIAQEIERQNIESNMEAALEYHPEAYGQVTMLYIDCKVNGHPVKAFVDSGAQSTIMSNACAERCNIVRLIDNRWSGIAKGVGTQRIIGRIHLCQVQIENDFLASSFTILQDQPMDMLLGLDMLKRHQCSIDLKKNLLHIGTTGTETRFLNENEIPIKDH
ncbi:Protein DDI1 -like protein 2 [Halotydeus destructor]|nr:Protein DDI1 -like protein 2 [Halotydeus destructor]